MVPEGRGELSGEEACVRVRKGAAGGGKASIARETLRRRVVDIPVPENHEGRSGVADARPASDAVGRLPEPPVVLLELPRVGDGVAPDRPVGQGHAPLQRVIEHVQAARQHPLLRWRRHGARLRNGPGSSLALHGRLHGQPALADELLRLELVV